MSSTAAAIVGTLLGFIVSGVMLLAFSVSKLRERLARLEQRVADRLDGTS
jgi:hypothetical protein